MQKIIVPSYGLFQRGGFLGRQEYFLTMLQIAVIVIVGTLVLTGLYAGGIASAVHVWNPSFLLQLPFWLILLALIFEGFVMYLAAITIFKRLRDIRGTESHELGWQAAVIVACLIPHVALCAHAFLFFKEGLLSAPGTALPLQAILKTFHEREAPRDDV